MGDQSRNMRIIMSHGRETVSNSRSKFLPEEEHKRLQN